MLALENDLWTYAIRVYANAEVAQVALALQDGHGVSVPLLIFCAWCERDRISLDKKDIVAATHAVREWDEEVTRPLRQARRGAKATAWAAPAITALGRSVQDSEIRSEQIALALLFAWRSTTKLAAGGAPMGVGNIITYLGLHSVPAPMAVKTVAAFTAADTENR